MRRYERFVEVGAPVEFVFDMFADFEAAPRWAGGVVDVRRTGRRTFRWVAETALGLDVEWEAEVVVFAPDRRIVWRSVAGDVRADCEAVFSVTPEGATLLRVIRGYDTPGGRTSARAVTSFYGRHPEEQLEEDLARFKGLAERMCRPGRRGRGERRPGEGGAMLRRPERGESTGVGARRAEEPQRRQDEPRRQEPREPYEEPRARHALTPRERQRERERELEERRAAEEVRAAGRYLRRGVDRLLERPHDDWRARRG